MKPTIIIILILLFLTACQKEQLTQEMEGDKTFCDEEANRLGITGDYYCDLYEDKMSIFFEKNELNKKIYEENK